MSITSIEWWSAAGIRALKTFCQTLIALIGTSAVNIISIDWLQILGVGATAALLSILTSLAGLPEVDGTVEVPEVELDEVEGE